MGFNDQLGPFIRNVWEAEKKLRRQARVVGGRVTRTYLTERDIYRLYGQNTVLPQVDLPKVQAFVRNLERIRAKRGHEVVVQADDWTAFGGVRDAVLNADPQRPPEAVSDAWDGFFHFLAKNRCGAHRRVYVHPANPDAGVVILEGVVDALDTPGGVGIDEVKIAGPGVNRLDTLIVYCLDDAAVQRVLARLGTIGAGHFGAGVPGGTRQVSNGVAVADEPSALEMWGGGPLQPVAAVSFGDFYAKLIHMALCYPDPRLPPQQQPSEAESLQQLEDNVKAAMVVCGVDPSRPEEIGRADTQIEALLRNAQAALRRRGR